jgi:hypothetical protein
MEIDALRRQGVVVAKPRGRNRYAYYMRFRVDGRERSRYLGVDASRAAAIGAALSDFQRSRRAQLELKRASSEAWQLLALTKQRLARAMQGSEFYFHGQRIRRRRNPYTAVGGESDC